MKYKYFILFFITSILFSSGGGYAGSSYKYGYNARQIALSNSLVSNYNKGYNALTNPALLGTRLSKLEYGFSYFSMSLDRSIQTFSISIPAPPSASIGLSLFTTSVDDIKGTDDNGNYTNLYKAWEGFGMLSFGLELEKISAGVNVKILKNEIDAHNGSGVGLDIGFLYKLSSRNQFAFLINNLHTKYTWEITSMYEEKFPQILCFGGSSKINKNILSMYQIDYSMKSKKIVYKFGVELDMLAMKSVPMDIRLGLNSKNDSFNPSLGFGYNIFTKNKLNLGIDYALDLGMVDEGMSHLFTLTFHKE